MDAKVALEEKVQEAGLKRPLKDCFQEMVRGQFSKDGWRRASKRSLKNCSEEKLEGQVLRDA